MNYTYLGRTGLKVSPLCLGTMNFGPETSEADSYAIMDKALELGINFFDTANVYGWKKGEGVTEQIVGRWWAQGNGRREKVVIATKVYGVMGDWPNESKLSARHIKQACEASLRRLQTDYIDLYQLHWPNRNSPHFGKHWPGKLRFSTVDAAAHTAQMQEILETLADSVKRGTIRHFGLSDDTPWGIQQYLRLADQHQWPRIVSIQNEFSLLHSKDWPYLIEQCVHERVAFLPWSPLATGALSGKYLGGARPAGSRWSLSQRLGLFRDNPQSENAITRYADIARKAGMTPAQLALAWCNQVDGVTSTIIGATSLEQLAEDIDAFDLHLSKETLSAVHTTLRQFPSPF